MKRSIKEIELIELQSIEARVIAYMCQSHRNLSDVFSDFIDYKVRIKQRLCYFKFFIHSEIISKLFEYKTLIEENKLSYNEIVNILSGEEYVFKSENNKEVINKSQILKILYSNPSENISDDMNILKMVALNSSKYNVEEDLSTHYISVFYKSDEEIPFLFFIYRNGYIDYIRTDNWNIDIPPFLYINLSNTISEIFDNVKYYNLNFRI